MLTCHRNSRRGRPRKTWRSTFREDSQGTRAVAAPGAQKDGIPPVWSRDEAPIEFIPNSQGTRVAWSAAGGGDSRKQFQVVVQSKNYKNDLLTYLLTVHAGDFVLTSVTHRTDVINPFIADRIKALHFAIRVEWDVKPYTLTHWSNPLFLIFDIWTLWRSGLSARVSKCQELKIVG